MILIFFIVYRPGQTHFDLIRFNSQNQLFYSNNEYLVSVRVAFADDYEEGFLSLFDFYPYLSVTLPIFVRSQQTCDL